MGLKPNIAIVIEGDLNAKREYLIQHLQDVFDELDLFYSINIFSEHKTPIELNKFVQSFDNLENYQIIIAVEPLRSTLSEAIASQTTKPVIRLPITSRPIDDELSLIQIPPKIAVASVSINDVENAALVAASILSLTTNNSTTDLTHKINSYREKEKQDIIIKNHNIDNGSGHRQYPSNCQF